LASLYYSYIILALFYNSIDAIMGNFLNSFNLRKILNYQNNDAAVIK